MSTAYQLTIETASGTRTGSIHPEETLLEALRRAGLTLSAPCGGKGVCGGCKVLLDGAEVLACQTKVTGDATVTLHELIGGSIAGTEDTLPRTPLPTAGLRAAVDLGTTTVVVELLGEDGERLGAASGWNAQAPYGADVISRCAYCMEHPEGTALLGGLIRDQVAGLVRSLGADPEEVELYLAGNTVMEHLYAGLSPASIGVAPFTPATLFREESFGPRLAPCVAGYLGGDITAGLYAAGFCQATDRPALFLDIGTNGEMVLRGPAGLIGCAVASGPAFEGVGISCGMPGLDGAVRHLTFTEGKLALDVIGGGEPRGLCGSGLVDLLAILVEHRAVSGTGRLLGPEEAPAELAPFLREDENGNGVFYLTPELSLTAADLRKLQLAKAAVAAGIEVLLSEAGLAPEALDALYLAGGFGTGLDPESAAAIGMIPQELAARTIPLGNSALRGARLALTEPGAIEAIGALAESIRYLELSASAAFNRAYPEQLLFYEEDEEWN